MKIAFADNFIGRRGSAVALYDFAHYNETILGNESIILIPKEHEQNDAGAIQKFKDRFQCFEHDWGNIDQADAIIKEQGVDVFYQVKGCMSDFQSRIVPNLIHMLFINTPEHYHGDQFAFISDWLSDLCKQRHGLDKQSVPWMIDLPEVDGDLREELGIPNDAFVFGYHGGVDCFGIPWVAEPIHRALKQRDNLYILLMNIDKSWTSINYDHPRLKFLPGTADMNRKVKFIQTCDAMLHARHHGETFGLSCGEFSMLGRPVVAATTVEDRCHIEILGDKLVGYSNPQELFNILMTMDSDFVNSQDWDCYSERFSPDAVMKKFKEVFLDPYTKRD
jgi:glycosyltransferase involved in cell wall biosynthesis